MAAIVERPSKLPANRVQSSTLRCRSVRFRPRSNLFDLRQRSFEFRPKILLVREVSWLRQKCDFHEEAVQKRCNWKVAGVFRTERRKLATHLDEIKLFVVRLLSQMKLARLSNDEVAAPSMMVRRLRWGGPDKGNVRCVQTLILWSATAITAWN